MLKKPSIVFLLLLWHISSIAQFDTNYVKQYGHKLCVTTSVNQMVYRLTIKDANNSGQKINYTNNAGLSYGIGIDYKWLALEYQHSFKQNSNDGLPANSDISSLSLRLSGQKYWVYTFFEKQEGLFLDSHTGIEWPDTPDPTLYRDDIKTTTLFISGNYIFNNKKYSNSAASYLIDRQIKSAGSFIAGLTLVSNTITSDSALRPTTYKTDIGENGKIVKGLVNSIIPAAGYAHNFVIHKVFYAHLAAMPGINFVAFVKKLDNKETEKGAETSGLYLESNVSLGYNGEKFFGGFTTYGYLYTGSVQANPITQNHQYFRLFFGIRLDIRKPKFFPEKII